MKLTAESITLKAEIEDLKLENLNLKEKLNYLNQQENNFIREKQRWRQ